MQGALERRQFVGQCLGEDGDDVLADLEGLQGPAVGGERGEGGDEDPPGRILGGPPELDGEAVGLGGEQPDGPAGAREERLGLVRCEPADEQHPTPPSPGATSNVTINGELRLVGVRHGDDRRHR